MIENADIFSHFLTQIQHDKDYIDSIAPFTYRYTQNSEDSNHTHNLYTL